MSALRYERRPALRSLGHRARDGGSSRLRGEAGQSLVETVISLTFLMLLVLGLLQLTMLSSTKHLVNYAAFAGGRAGMYGTSNDPLSLGEDQRAAQAVLRMFNIGRSRFTQAFGGSYSVRWATPFALPIFPFAGGVVWIESRVPMVQQPNIGENGDNAGR